MASAEPIPTIGAHEDSPGDSNENAVEMKSLETQTGSGEGSKDAAASSSTTPFHQDMSQSVAPVQESIIASNSSLEPSTQPTSSSEPATTAAAASSSEPSTSTSAAPELSRFDSVAIGPATDAIAAPPANPEAGPVCHISLLISHTGARHAYKIDEKYLTRRNVNVPDDTESGKKDPFSISVYTLKELIQREWKAEWDAKPSSPSSIRLIYFGKLLDDKKTLRESLFKEGIPNVVHIAVKPQDMVDDEEATKSKALGREGGDGESTAGCRCVIL